MIKWLFILLFSFSIGLFSAQSSDAKKRILNMVEKLERVPPYSCDVNINIDVKFIRIKERVGKMIYRSPEDIDYKIKGFAFLPKKEMGTTSTSLFKDDFIAIDMGKENENQIIKVIPMDINSEIVTGQFWIDSADLVQKMILITKEKGSYTAEMNYNGTLYDLPSKIRMSFDVKNQKMPALLTGDLEAYTDEMDEDEVSKGTITIMYSNHQF
ncbi:MAG: hypothetical protein VX462_06300 [Bacteroidota bacterium]|nr:hypothetical protein [Bacteroidota bacterium]